MDPEWWAGRDRVPGTEHFPFPGTRRTLRLKGGNRKRKQAWVSGERKNRLGGGPGDTLQSGLQPCGMERILT